MKFQIFLFLFFVTLSVQAQVSWDVQSPENFGPYNDNLESNRDFKFFPINETSESKPKKPSLEHDYLAFDESLLYEDWMATYDVVIVVNRAVTGLTAQTLKMYYQGARYIFGQDEYGQDIDTLKVSSGLVYNGRSATPVGYFNPTYLSRNHVHSRTKVPMPFAVFFMGNYGIHRVPLLEQEAYLGTPVSAGCVRVSKDYVDQIFNLVESAGMGRVAQVNRSGVPLRNSRGELVIVQNYKTLIIVEDKTEI